MTSRPSAWLSFFAIAILLASGACVLGSAPAAAWDAKGQRFDLFSARPGAAPERPLLVPAARPGWLAVDAGAVRALRGAGRGRVRLPLGDGRDLDLSLERWDLLAPGATVTRTDDHGPHAIVPDVMLFRGEVEGVPGSQVTLSCSADGVLGVVAAPGERWCVGPAVRGERTAGSVPHLVVRERDLVAAAPRFECGADLLADAMGLGERLAPPRREMTATASRLTCQVAVDCDYEFFSSKFGSSLSGATQYVLTVMAVVSAIYERDLNTTLEVSYLNLWTTAGDPYTQTTTSAQLPEFRDYWNANRGGVSRHIAHLFSGRSLGGGIAYLGVLCNPPYAYGVSALDAYYAYPSNTVTWDAYVLAHEMGHNFDSRHTHSCYWQDNGLVPHGALIDSCYTAEGPCFSGPTGILPFSKGTIMSYCHQVAGVANGIRLDFHPVCAGVMRTHAETCLPVTLFPPPQPLVATAGAGGVTLSWTASSRPDVIRNDVHRSVTMLDPAPPWLGSTPGTSMADDNVLGTYYYKVRAATVSDTSDFSNEVRVTACAPAAPAYFAAGSAVVAPLIGDFNADGIADLAVANNNASGTVSILLGLGAGGVGNGAFASPVPYACGTKPVWLAAGDFNADGITDLAVANNGTTGSWSLLFGQGVGGVGNGTFAAPVTFPALSKPSALAAADFDEDGILDLAVASNGNGIVSVHRGLGTGGIGSGAFSDSVDYHVDLRPTAMECGDFNNDGIADLAVVCNGSGTACILLGQGADGIGNGAFAPSVSYSAGTAATALAAGDFDGDGIADLAVVRNVSQGRVAVLLGNGSGGTGDGTFAPAVQYVAGTSANAIVAADLNGNGATDLAVVNGSGTVSVLLGQLAAGAPTGAFDLAQAFDVGGTPQGIAAGDFDEDGIADLVVTKSSAVQNVGERRGACAPLAGTAIALLSPNGGEEWPMRSEQVIEWTTGPAVAAVRVEVSRDGGLHWQTIASRHPGKSLTWTVTPPASGASQALVRVSDATVPGRADLSDSPFSIIPPFVGVPAARALPLAIHRVYPNPAPGAPTVAFSLPSGGPARLELMDVAGRRVASRTLAGLGPGRHSVRLTEGGDLPTGLYLIRLVHGARVVTAKAVITR